MPTKDTSHEILGPSHPPSIRRRPAARLASLRAWYTSCLVGGNLIHAARPASTGCSSEAYFQAVHSLVIHRGGACSWYTDSPPRLSHPLIAAPYASHPSRPFSSAVFPPTLRSLLLTPAKVERATQLAEEQGVPNAKFQVTNALDMTFEDESFDLVWACESGEHMPDKGKYIEEMTRVLKPGG